MTITFQLEEYSDEFKQDVSEIMQLHGDEFTYDKEAKGDVDPNWDLGLLLKNMHRLYLSTARDDGRLIGYFVFYTSPMAHYKSVTAAIEDTFYLLPEYRGNKIGYNFIKYSVSQMKATGATVLRVANKVKADYRKMWERLGFEQEEIVYTQTIQN